MKILITGGNGLLGEYLIFYLKKKGYNVYGTYKTLATQHTNFFQLDITQQKNVLSVFNKIIPDVVIHTAACTDVDFCQKHIEIAYDVNFHGSKNIVECAQKLGALVVYISTDYVFNGEKGWYDEKDQTDPINVYGLSKLEGEKAVQSICSEYIIARTSVIFGSKKNNFALWVLDALRNGKEISVVKDQFVSPTLNIDLAEQVTALVENNVRGIFHTAGGERINRYDFVKELAKTFQLDFELVKPASASDMKWDALRPKDSSLNITKVARYKKPFKIHHSLDKLKDELRENHSL